eukprot:scaffold4151_cov162-Amphora_coffeaeformis.AAC.12
MATQQPFRHRYHRTMELCLGDCDEFDQLLPDSIDRFYMNNSSWGTYTILPLVYLGIIANQAGAVAGLMMLACGIAKFVFLAKLRCDILPRWRSAIYTKNDRAVVWVYMPSR